MSMTGLRVFSLATMVGLATSLFAQTPATTIQPMMSRNTSPVLPPRNDWVPQSSRSAQVPHWKRDFFSPNRRPARIPRQSWVYVEVPNPKEIKEHDIVTIIVDEKAEVSVNSQFNRQRNNSFKLDLKKFIRLDDDGNLAGSAANAPGIDSAIQERIQTNGQTKEAESVKYRIAATVANVYPNGNLVLIARKRIQTDDELWAYELSGILSSKDILPNRTASSENIADLHIRKRQMGKVYSSTKWRWGMRLMDMLSPF